MRNPSRSWIVPVAVPVMMVGAAVVLSGWLELRRQAELHREQLADNDRMFKSGQIAGQRAQLADAQWAADDRRMTELEHGRETALRDLAALTKDDTERKDATEEAAGVRLKRAKRHLEHYRMTLDVREQFASIVRDYPDTKAAAEADEILRSRD